MQQGQPTYDLSRPNHWAPANTFAQLNIELIRTLASDAVALRWKTGNFFNQRFGPEKKTTPAAKP